eukprot:7290683-Pyramimonas_sp.AAC.1
MGETPTEVDPGFTPGNEIDPLELAQAKYSAFCGGRLVSPLLSDSAWHSLIQEDLGLLPVSYTHLRAHETGAYL